jgi:hypothetical protein
VVQAGPTTGLGPAQSVWLHLYGFTPGDLVDVRWCAHPGPLSAASPPLCAGAPTAALPHPVVAVAVAADGTASLAFQVEGGAPVSGAVPGGTRSGTFSCAAAGSCAVDVTDPSLAAPPDPVPVPATSAAVPVSFAPSAPPCAAATLPTESDDGLGPLLATAAADACASSTPARAANTASDSLAAVRDVVAGKVTVAFTDDPGAPEERTALAQSGVALIPVALTAAVVAYRADVTDPVHHVIVGDHALSLTANQVAGLLTGRYRTPSDADLVPCTATPACPDPVPCPAPSSAQCTSLLGLLDPTTPDEGPDQYGAVVRSDPTGATDAVQHWICAAPSSPVGLPGGGTVTDPNVAAATFQDGLGSLVQACPGSSRFPALDPAGALWWATPSAAGQAAQLTGAKGLVPPTGPGTAETAGFAPMTWPQALYYGLDVAGLQGAGGTFVTPSADGVDAALGAPAPAGTQAYPLPVVVYAAVPTRALPAAQAVPLHELLTALLQVAGRPAAAQPEGYLPLTPALLSAATADVAGDLHTVPGTVVPPTTPTGPTAPAPSPTTPASPGPAWGLPDTSVGPTYAPVPISAALAGAVAAADGSGLAAGTPAPAGGADAKVGLRSAGFAQAVTDGRWLAPGLAATLLVALILGPGVLAVLEIRRRLRPAGAAPGDDPPA